MAEFVDVVLVGPGDDKIRVIKALRDVTCDEPALAMLDLRAAKRLTDTTPCVALPTVRSDVAAKVKEVLESAGATVELRPA